jgi:hypothetical protein
MSVVGDHVVLLTGVVTSVGAAVLGVRLLCLSARALPATLTTVMDVLGLALAFCVANGVLGVIILLVERHLGGGQVSLHRVDDVGLYVVSLLQAIAFQAWRTSKRPPR